ncbi:ABC transporter substrate-binding protein [Pseudomonas sp. sp1636]|uniref:ABC transporter substrate-binding protein n=1 Tax=Pseudomonas sp. sp1636 TaxID=3036707 RepID=UPI0025A5E35B|nr:ABC transporter substrate-binding protein [Pseudomonas sp. sp1636]MDM8348660.1 ABC transporter substrate-binding protein [Pseudomonas sp. sp1636]
MKISLVRININPVRRLLLGATGLLLISLSLHGSATPPREEVVRLAGPAAVVSFPLLHMVDSGALAEFAERVEFRLWQNPDQLGALLANDAIDFTAAPSNLPALLANRGQPVRLLSISVWGILWLVSRDPQIKGFADLAGKELLLPYQRDLPALLVNELLRAHGLRAGEDLRLRHVRDSQDAQALLLAGQADHVLLVEPAVSLLLWRNQQQGGAPLYRAQSLEAAWNQAFPEQPELPQAGLMASARAARKLELSQAVERAYGHSARWCAGDPQACAELVQRHLPHLPVAAIAASIRATRLDSRPAHEVRGQLEALYRLLGEHNPQAIGGRLPAAEFYGP